ncbi:MAG: tripartite tricarboxylate transporter substrate binding protein [Alphaproteobacteria bacterium]|nr:tripartite tricarboxylate transporter substrate binding protein [Alphaproteobacteria bacterium]
MSRSGRALGAVALALSLMLASAAVASAQAQSQAWPSKPIRLIAPYPPGGQTDVVARYFAEKLQATLGQTVIVENKAGAQGIVGTEAAKNAPPDGYTFVYVNVSTICINPFVHTRLPYDAARDFVPVTQHGLSVLAMVVPATLGPKTVKEFIAYAKANRGKVSYASFGQGSSSHIYGESLNQMADLGMQHVPYKGAAPATQDVLAGHVPMTIQDLAAVGPHIAAGKLVGLAVTSPQRWPRLPDIPSFDEQGYPLNLVGWNGIMAPAGTPPAIVERLGDEIRKLVHAPEGKEKLLDMGLLATGTTSAEMAELIRGGCARWGEAVRRAGIKPE